MIYSFKSTVVSGKEKRVKQFYLTAENDSAFYKRCMDQYRLDKHNIEILEKIDDDLIYAAGFDNKNSKPVFTKGSSACSKVVEKKDNSNLKLAADMLTGKVNGLSQDDIDNRVAKGFVFYEVGSKKKLAELLNKYKTVKLYYLRTGAKKNKKYIALCR